MVQEQYWRGHDLLVQVPVGAWAKDKRMKDIGRYQQAVYSFTPLSKAAVANFQALLDSVEAYSLALFTRVLGWELSRVHLFLALVRQELKDVKDHLYILTYVIYGRKPQV